MMENRPLTDEQECAVRWYIGDVEGADPFWGDAKAYVTLNALFFPGILAETARAAEGKRLNPALLADEPRLRRVLGALLASCRPLAQYQNVYRVERYCDYVQICEQGSRTLSFTSTSTAGFLRAYQDRRGITLMRFQLPAGTPVIDMAQALQSYNKPEEAEILLPPFMKLKITEQPLTLEEMQILDADGAPPRVSVIAVPDGIYSPSGTPDAVPDAYRLAGIRVLQALSVGAEPDAEDVRCYSIWKAALTDTLFYTDFDCNT